MDKKPKLLLGEEVYQVAGAAMEVINELGHGLHEKPYENSLVVEFNLRGVSYKHQPNYQVFYKGYEVGLFIPDLIAFEKVVVDGKVIDSITDIERGQMLNYLKITKLRVGGYPELPTSETGMGKNLLMIGVDWCSFVVTV